MGNRIYKRGEDRRGEGRRGRGNKGQITSSSSLPAATRLPI